MFSAWLLVSALACAASVAGTAAVASSAVLAPQDDLALVLPPGPPRLAEMSLSADADARVDPVSITAASLIIVSLCIKTATAITNGLVAVVEEAARQQSDAAAAASTKFLQRMSSLYDGIVGDAELRLKDTIAEIGLDVLKSAPDADIAATGRAENRKGQAAHDAAVAAYAAAQAAPAPAPSKGKKKGQSKTAAGGPTAAVGSAPSQPAPPVSVVEDAAEADEDVEGGGSESPPPAQALKPPAAFKPAPELPNDLAKLSAALSASGGSSAAEVRKELFRIMRGEYESLAEGGSEAARRRILLGAAPSFERFASLLGWADTASAVVAPPPPPATTTPSSSSSSSAAAAAAAVGPQGETVEERAFALSAALGKLGISLREDFKTASALLSPRGRAAGDDDGDGAPENTHAEVVASVVEFGSVVSGEITSELESIGSEMESGGLKNFYDVSSNAGGAIALVGSVVGLISSSVDLGRGLSAFINAKFLAARQTGLAFEAQGAAIDYGAFLACRQFASLHEVMKASFASASASSPSSSSRARLFELVGTGDLVTVSDPATKAALGEKIYGRLCHVFSPIFARLNAMFRAGGHCAAQARKYGAPETTDAALLPITSKVHFAPDVRTCKPGDIYHVVLTGREHVAAWAAVGYSPTWDEKHAYEVLWGELNDKVDRLFSDSGATGLNRANVAKTQAPGEVPNSRLLMVLRCAAVQKALRLRERNLALNPLTPQEEATAKWVEAIDVSRPLNDIIITSREPLSHRASAAEKAAWASGMKPLKYVTTPADVLAGKKAPAIAYRTVDKFRRFVKGGAKTGWDNAINAQSFHSKSYDIHAGRGDDTQVQVIFVKYGGPSPIEDLVLLPFEDARRPDGALGDATSSEFSILEAHRVGGKGLYQKEMKATGFTAKTVEKLGAPKGCLINDKVVRTKKVLKFAGVKHYLNNLLHGSHIVSKKQRMITYHHEFEVTCTGIPDYEKWVRIATSPYQRVKRGVNLIRVTYVWFKRRHIVPTLPTGEDELVCPAMCPPRSNPPPPAQKPAVPQKRKKVQSSGQGPYPVVTI